MGPWGGWTDWLEEQIAIDPPRPRPWISPPAGTPVLIVGDLGLLLGAGSGPARQWAAFAESLARAGLRPLALAPLGSGQLNGPMARLLPILRWSPDARMHPERAHGEGQPLPEALADLLALLAVLRALRRWLPNESVNAGLEGALWCHPEVEAGTVAAVRREYREPHLDRFRALLPALQMSLARLQRRHHAHLPAALHWEEGLSFAAHACREAVADPEVARAIEARADTRMAERYGHLLLPLVAERVRFERDVGIVPQVPDWVDPAELAARLESGGGAATLAWLVRDAESGCVILQAHPPGPRQSPMGEPLIVDGGGVRISSYRSHALSDRSHAPSFDRSHAPRGNASHDGHRPPTPRGADRAAFPRGAWERSDGSYWLSAEQLPAALVPLDAAAEFTVETAREFLEIRPLRRPRGTEGWACNPRGIEVRSPEFLGRRVGWSASTLYPMAGPATESAEEPAWTLHSPWETGPLATEDGFTLGMGLDRYGVYADLTLATDHGRAGQRFRRMEPGTFLMGSPEDEPGRDNDEGPRHPVTLTRGFWLADTPCTQALWKAVMGENPSRFTGHPQRPVEQVSWNDVQGFLRKLEALVPGARAELPTEAEWEYACWAGTETALYTGPIAIHGANNAPALDPIAWYGGNSGIGFEGTNGVDSSNWPEKQYPDSPSGSHPVGQKQANAFGLYDMLGKVWEWCADGPRTYTIDPVVDPVGPVEDALSPRAVRGGSWNDSAGGVRSACRGGSGPGGALGRLGFRLCLRSIEPGPARSRATGDSLRS